MQVITSQDNRTVRLWKQLETRKYRDRLGMYLIEGKNLLEEADREGADVYCVLAREDYGDVPDRLAEKCVWIEKKLYDMLAQTDTSQGIMAIVEKPKFSSADFTVNNGRGSFVVLDRLQDPGNIGAIIRTADAAGYGMAVIKGTADVYSPKVVRAAAGSLFRVPVAFLANNDELISFCGRAGARIAATSPNTGRYYYEEDLTGCMALVIGNEGNGVSSDLIERADLKLKIPMSGNIESLNASVAAAVIMYESVRQSASLK